MLQFHIYNLPKLTSLTAMVMLLSILVGCGQAPEASQASQVSQASEIFSYQVRVKVKDTEQNIPNARVTIEIRDKATINEDTDANGIARFIINNQYAGQPAKLTVNATGFKSYLLNVDIDRDRLPNTIPLEQEVTDNIPTLTPITTEVPTNTVAPPSTEAAVPPTNVPTETATPQPVLTEKELEDELKKLNVILSQTQEEEVRKWLSNTGYRFLAENTLTALAGRRLIAPVPLDVINETYKAEIKKPGENISLGEYKNLEAYEPAILAAWNKVWPEDRATSLSDIVR